MMLPPVSGSGEQQQEEYCKMAPATSRRKRWLTILRVRDATQRHGTAHFRHI